MSPYNDHQPHPLIKSESPPLQSVPISSIGQPYSHYSDSSPLFRFGTKEQNAPLPPFSFISRPRSSSSFSPHSAMSHLNAYSSAVSGSQSHFAVPPADDPGVLTPTDEYDDDEAGDFPSASGSSSKMDKSVRRRSSKGASRFSTFLPFDCTDYGPRTQLVISVVNPSASVRGQPQMSHAKLASCWEHVSLLLSGL